MLQVYATAGKLVKILLTNFMCHRHLEVTFHDNVNVILGRNGSKLMYACTLAHVTQELALGGSIDLHVVGIFFN